MRPAAIGRLAISSFGHIFLGVYLLVLVVLCIYGAHRYSLVFLYYRHWRQAEPRALFLELPRVTVQLPMYNEPRVVRRIIESAAALDYPRDRLEIQVLDDSTDETTRLAEETVRHLARQGINIVLLHRGNREGYKAGALAAATPAAQGEFIAIFDADFVPQRDVLRRMIHHFTDPEVGVVQGRWEHLNREQSLLTKTQAILLDGHFHLEHAARNCTGRFISFNGTAGMWRKSCIDDAGGWKFDTLIEDKDLSYRAQMRGWRFVFLPDVGVPAELPPEMTAFKVQQHRWTKGGVQTLRKLFWQVMRARLPLKVKVEAFFHLTHCTVYLYVVALTLMIFPALLLRRSMYDPHPLLQVFFDLSLFALATCSAACFYAASQRIAGRSWLCSLKNLPFLMSMGLGLALHNARAALAGLKRQTGEFARTPKFAGDNVPGVSGGSPGPATPRRRKINWLGGAELTIGVYFLGCIAFALTDRILLAAVPFLAMFMVGYLYVGCLTLAGSQRRAAPALSVEKPLAGGAEPAGMAAPVLPVPARPSGAGRRPVAFTPARVSAGLKGEG